MSDKPLDTRVQRTRSWPSAPHSPLTRRPSGGLVTVSATISAGVSLIMTWLAVKGVASGRGVVAEAVVSICVAALFGATAVLLGRRSPNAFLFAWIAGALLILCGLVIAYLTGFGPFANRPILFGGLAAAAGLLFLTIVAGIAVEREAA